MSSRLLSFIIARQMAQKTITMAYFTLIWCVRQSMCLVLLNNEGKDTENALIQHEYTFKHI